MRSQIGERHMAMNVKDAVAILTPTIQGNQRLCSPKAWIGTIGHISSETPEKYISEQLCS